MARNYTLHGEGYLPSKLNVKKHEPAPPKPSSHVHARKYSRPNWFTASGVALKRKRIESRGLPSFKGWRFITLTVDPERFESPLEAFLVLRARMRNFLHACRSHRLWAADAKWCWKLEFQENGWPHWHLLVSRRAIFSEAEMRKVSELWGAGRVNIEMVQEHGFAYTFKYAFKPVAQSEDDSDGFNDGDGTALPAWFQDYFKPGSDGQKPQSFARVRFWQTSAGFYKKPAPKSEKAGVPQSSILPRPVREIVHEVDNSVQVIGRKRCGQYVKSAVVALTCSFASLATFAGWHAIGGTAVVMDIGSYVLPASAVLSKTKPESKHQLCQILQENHLTLRRAEILRERGERLRTC